MRRFLRYAVERGRGLRMMLMLDGKIAQKTVHVISYDDNSVTLTVGARRKPVTLPIEDILSCDYTRGDHGDSQEEQKQ